MKKSMCLAAVVLLGMMGCGSDPEQSSECKAYLACIKATTPGIEATAEITYGSEGSCWKTDETAEVCTASCKDGLVQLRGSYPNESACK